MEFTDVQAYLNENMENDDIKSFVAGLNPINLDKVKDFVGKDKDAQSWLDSEKDKHSSKSLKTWQENNLSKIVDEKIKELYPETDPKDVKLNELQKQIQDMQKETLRKELMNTALKTAQEKKLPTDLLDFFIGEDEKSTLQNLEVLEKAINSQVAVLVQEKINGGYKPPTGDKTTLTLDQIKNMSEEEINKNWDIVTKVLSQQK